MSRPSATSSGPSAGGGVPPQNDDYISTFGHEAPEPERGAIAAMVTRYYTAALAGRGAIACSLIVPGLRSSISSEYGPVGTRRRSGCASVLPSLFARGEGLTRAQLANTRVTGVRVRGLRGFVQLSSAGMASGEIAIERQAGGAWELDTVVGRPCRHCAAY